MNEDRMETMLQKFDRLPSLPGTAMKLIEAVQRPDPDVREVVRLVSADAALSAKVLKIINSSFYGFVHTVTTIDQAIRLLGMKTIKNLALSLILKTSFLKKDPRHFDMAGFWKDALVGAIAAKLLAERVNVKNAEDTFFLGLLENIGSLTLAYLIPDQYERVQSEMQTRTVSCEEAESQVFGFNHMDVGAKLTRSWGLPDTFHIPIKYHHRVEELPEGYSSEIRMRTAVLHLSALYIELFNAGNMAEVLGRITQGIDAYGFGEHIDAADIGRSLVKQTQALFPIFDLEFMNEQEMEGLIEKAKQEVLKLSLDLVNDLIEKNSELEMMRLHASKDALTQLYNYKAFREALDQEIRRASRYRHSLCLLFGDIDHFKSINDGFGHLAGDQVLKMASQNLKDALRDSDFIARYGGEEFAIILPETEFSNALRVAERLRTRIRAMEVSYDHQPIRVTISLGVAAFRHAPPMTFNDLVKAADEALYAAKKQGRDRCCGAPQGRSHGVAPVADAKGAWC